MGYVFPTEVDQRLTSPLSKPSVKMNGEAPAPDNGASSEHLFEAARAAVRVSKGAGGQLINVAGAA